jgi:tetratricopeptide (TPR) repeat protein
MVGVQFRFSGTPGADAIGKYRWDFGDGLSSAAPAPDHVYMRPGLFTARLDTVDQEGRRGSVTKLVQVDPVWRDQDFRRPKLDAFWDATKDYDVKPLETDSLLGAWRFWRSIEQRDAADRALQVLSERHADLTDADRYEVAMDMADHYHDREWDPEKAEQWLHAALAVTEEDDLERRWRTRFALADHYYYYERDPAKGRMEYEKLRIDYPQADPAKRRLALIRIGDTYRSQAKVEQALERYREAEQDTRYQPQQPRAVVVGATLQKVQAYMARGEGGEALKALEELLWSYPTLRVDGKTTLLRCQAAMQQEDWREAKKHADAYIEFSEDPNYLPSIHMIAARACEILGLEDEAAAHYRKVAQEFREAPEAAKAADALLRYE